ncbi:uncharacterized protein LOC122245976 [Penaeus japonicus]|uniref:uncharacterized protein LOC122245976 n=1 Tax=Penaeus japonicus TaxID=27405 RepID=UPI001C712FDF|nr:uncharacterized protein LOC122245976 [Penaeus japonicus]XP_042860108.1 uncharacterized protein LOC122245976 [Penaeus japonicus]XP_042860109.1 uncharacterized protein LOC122245976 [Penaeus japonicus]XP_042860110.1 uncharacterized protein LOC122245976 [Penaeus japonicus]
MIPKKDIVNCKWKPALMAGVWITSCLLLLFLYCLPFHYQQSPFATALSSGTQHPVFSHECYRNSATKIQNNCCRLHKYSLADIVTCSEGFANSSAISTPGNGRRYPGMNNERDWKTEGLHWVLVGDSRMRQLFTDLAARLSPARALYRVMDLKSGKWKPSKNLLPLLLGETGPLHSNAEVYLPDAPLRITFYWDPVLEYLPGLLRGWGDTAPLPSILVVNSGLHWIVESAEAFATGGRGVAAAPFSRAISRLVPELDRLSADTPVVFQLIDHVQESRNTAKLQQVQSNINIDYYNDILTKAVAGTNITLWSSTVCLSDLYIQECTENPYLHDSQKLWMCQDGVHVGYVMVIHYVRMLLNFVCNRVLGLGRGFC